MIGEKDMIEKILKELEQKIAADKAKGYKGSCSVEMEMPSGLTKHITSRRAVV